jgi:hypothetical protein
MANNFLQKYVADKRTGANLVGIHVDTQSQYLLDRGSGAAMLSALEEIGKKADEAKIQNEKQNLLLSAEEQDLQFKKEILSDPLLYKDEERYRNALTQFETIRREKESRILKSEYLTADEKKLMARRIRNNDELTLVDMMSKRNGVVIEKQVDDIIANMDRRVAISSDLSLNDVKGAELAIQDFTDMADNLQKLTGMTDSEVSLLVSERVMRMEEGRFNKAINEIVNSSMNLDQKRAKINNLLSVVKNDNLLTKMAESYASQIKYSKTDEEFKTSVEFFKSRINDVYDNVKNFSTRELTKMELNTKAKERNVKQLLNTENKIRRYIKSGDSYKLAKELTGIEYTTDEMVNDNYTLKTIYGVDMEVLGNADDNSVGKIIAKEDINQVKQDIQTYKSNGHTNNSAIREAVYNYANGVAGDNIEIRNGVLKHLGKELRINPTVLLKGEEDNNYFDVQEKLNKGKEFEFDGEVKESFFNKESKRRYDSLLQTLGGTEKAKKALNSYIYGLYLEDAILDEKSLKLNPSAVIQVFLKDDENYDNLKEKLKYINELGVAPVKYNYVPVKAENFNINRIVANQIEETETTTEIKDDGDMYEF